MDARKLNRMFEITLAVMLVNFNGFAQQAPTSAFTFKTLVSPGVNIGGHPLGTAASIEGIAVNDIGDVAFVAHSTDAGTEHRGCVLTLKHVVACDLDVVDGKTLTKVIATSLAINNSGQVGFEATFGDPAETGIFTDHKFVVALNGAPSADDFTLTDDGRVVLKPGAAGTAPSAPSTGKAPGPKKVNILAGIAARIPAALTGRWSPLAGGGVTVTSQSQAAEHPTPQQTTPLSKGAPAQLLHECATPKFPYPPEFGIGAEMSGPIASHVFEDPQPGRPYNSPFFGEMNTPFRVIQFSQNCTPLSVVLGDNAMRGLFEFWTPAGLLFRTKPDGILDLEEFAGKFHVGLLVRADTPMRISRKGQIAIPVKSNSGDYILLATPVIGPH